MSDGEERVREGNGPYAPRTLSGTLRCRVRDADYCLRAWGPISAPPLLLLHGRNDTSITFQFLVDAIGPGWRLLAPDWRGHGHTHAMSEGAWFHELLADLDALLDGLRLDRADIIGHSLGGNVASVYAVLRPARVRRLVALDAFGMMPLSEKEMIASISSWLRGPATALKSYQSVDDIAQRLCRANQRLGWSRALFLARHVSRQLPDGRWTWQFDPRLRRSMPLLRSLSEWSECWRRIEARALWIASSEPRPGTVRANAQAFAQAVDAIGTGRMCELPDTGHNIHHDAPRRLAEVIERFLEDG